MLPLLLRLLWLFAPAAAVTTARLADGPSPYAGRLEVLYGTSWGPVCQNGFGHAEAVVACRQLGFATGSIIQNSSVSISPQNPWFGNVSCKGSEGTLQACSHSAPGTADCNTSSLVHLNCTNNRTIRLVDFGARYAGRLEVLSNGTWGTVSETFFNLNTASVVCRQLGLPTGLPMFVPEIPQGTGAVLMDQVLCTGYEPDIESCPHVAYPLVNQDHRYDVGVACDPKTVRLAGGSARKLGVLQVYHDGQWGTVCDHGFGVREANVTCLQLGFDGGVVLYESALALGMDDTGPMWLDQVTCTGLEPGIEACSHSDWIVDSSCTAVEDSVVLSCYDELDIRLSPENRVEVLINDTWGTVCSHGFGSRDALVICNQFGYSDGAPVLSGVAPGSGPIWISDIECSGVETDFVACNSLPFGTLDPSCTHDTDVGVSCMNYTMVRLVDAYGDSNVSSGRLEVHHDGVWGSVCQLEPGFQEYTARVICQQLGFDHGFILKQELVPRGTGQIWLKQPYCLGNETTFGDCQTGDWGYAACSHSQDVGLRCSTARVEDGYRLEIYHDGIWGSVCATDTPADDLTASIACDQLGYADGRASARSLVVPGSTLQWLSDVACIGIESSVDACPSSGFGNVSERCTHADDLGIECDLFSRVRLVDDNNDFSFGRLEILHRGIWGSVCGDTLGADAVNLVCQQLGFAGGALVPRGSYPIGTGPVWLSNVTCDLDDDDLSRCLRSPWGQPSCGHSHDLGIQCDITQVRLTGGSDPSSGLLEVFRGGQWGAVCDAGFDTRDANVTCRMLGYLHGGSVFNRPASALSLGAVLLDNIDCVGHEQRIDQCYLHGWNAPMCGSTPIVVGVTCNTARKAAGPVVPRGAAVALSVALPALAVCGMCVLVWRWWMIREGKLPSSRLFPCGPASPFVIPFADIKLAEEIGKGGQGIVMKGLWKNASVAVKMLQPTEDGSSNSSQGYLRRALLKEADALKKLQHPNIVRVFGYCMVPNLAIVMEYVNSGTLATWIRVNAKLHDVIAMRQRWQIMRGILAGMQVVHDSGFVHCDLKPGNVLLVMDGDDVTAKVSDLGLGLKVDRTKTAPSRKRGTPGYMAPELCSPNCKSVSQKVDVYSFGVLMVELFTGQLEWGETLPDDPRARSARLCQLSLLHTLPVVPDTPHLAWLKNMLHLCTAFNPADRPGFADLSRLMSARSESPSSGEKQAPRRHVRDASLVTTSNLFISECDSDEKAAYSDSNPSSRDRVPVPADVHIRVLADELEASEQEPRMPPDDVSNTTPC